MRFLSAAGFLWFAFEAWQKRQQPLTVAFVLLAVLFQPLVKITLSRETWNVIDVLAAIGLVALFLVERKREATKHDNNSLQ